MGHHVNNPPPYSNCLSKVAIALIATPLYYHDYGLIMSILLVLCSVESTLLEFKYFCTVFYKYTSKYCNLLAKPYFDSK